MYGLLNDAFQDSFSIDASILKSSSVTPSCPVMSAMATSPSGLLFVADNQGVVNVWASKLGSNSVLPQTLSSFRTTYPHVSISDETLTTIIQTHPLVSFPTFVGIEPKLSLIPSLAYVDDTGAHVSEELLVMYGSDACVVYSTKDLLANVCHNICSIYRSNGAYLSDNIDDNTAGQEDIVQHDVQPTHTITLPQQRLKTSRPGHFKIQSQAYVTSIAYDIIAVKDVELNCSIKQVIVYCSCDDNYIYAFNFTDLALSRSRDVPYLVSWPTTMSYNHSCPLLHSKPPVNSQSSVTVMDQLSINHSIYQQQQQQQQVSRDNSLSGIEVRPVRPCAIAHLPLFAPLMKPHSTVSLTHKQNMTDHDDTVIDISLSCSPTLSNNNNNNNNNNDGCSSYAYLPLSSPASTPTVSSVILTTANDGAIRVWQPAALINQIIQQQQHTRRLGQDVSSDLVHDEKYPLFLPLLTVYPGSGQIVTTPVLTPSVTLPVLHKLMHAHFHLHPAVSSVNTVTLSSTPLSFFASSQTDTHSVADAFVVSLGSFIPLTSDGSFVTDVKTCIRTVSDVCIRSSLWDDHQQALICLHRPSSSHASDQDVTMHASDVRAAMNQSDRVSLLRITESGVVSVIDHSAEPSSTPSFHATITDHVSSLESPTSSVVALASPHEDEEQDQEVERDGETDIKQALPASSTNNAEDADYHLESNDSMDNDDVEHESKTTPRFVDRRGLVMTTGDQLLISTWTHSHNSLLFKTSNNHGYYDYQYSKTVTTQEHNDDHISKRPRRNTHDGSAGSKQGLTNVFDILLGNHGYAHCGVGNQVTVMAVYMKQHLITPP